MNSCPAQRNSFEPSLLEMSGKNPVPLILERMDSTESLVVSKGCRFLGACVDQAHYRRCTWDTEAP
jgi:hypothetical protein